MLNPAFLAASPFWEHLATEALPATVIYSLAGILLALLGFRLLDWLTPGDLNRKMAVNTAYAEWFAEVTSRKGRDAGPP